MVCMNTMYSARFAVKSESLESNIPEREGDFASKEEDEPRGASAHEVQNHTWSLTLNSVRSIKRQRKVPASTFLFAAQR